MKARITKRLAPIGYVAVDKRTALECYRQGIELLVAGNNVNYYHLLDGWHLAYRISRNDDTERTADESFTARINDFMFYLEPELGRYPVYYVNRLPL